MFGLTFSVSVHQGGQKGRHVEAAWEVVGTLVEGPHILDDWGVQQKLGPKCNLARPASRDLLSPAKSNHLMAPQPPKIVSLARIKYSEL